MQLPTREEVKVQMPDRLTAVMVAVGDKPESPPGESEPFGQHGCSAHDMAAETLVVA